MTLIQRFIFIWSPLALSCWCALGVVPPLTSITLAWDKALSHGPEIEFELQWGSSTNSASTEFYNNSVNVGTNLSCTVTNPTTGYLYFRVVAVKPVVGMPAVKSLPSNVVGETNFPAAPTVLSIDRVTTSSVRIEGQYPGSTNWIHLATVENDPVSFRESTKALLLRAKTVVPPKP